MTIARALAALVLTAAALAAPAAAAPAGDGITVAHEQRLNARLTEYTLQTPALADSTPLRVLLPGDYAEHPDRRYPVLYLLHGCCNYDVSGAASWSVHGEVEKATEGLGLIVVMPDGGEGGMYSDWYNGGAGGPPEWERYHIGQLIPWVDGRFRTVAGRGGRAIAGLSMGGFGAMSYAARHPDLFVAASSYSGIVDNQHQTGRYQAVDEILAALDGGTPGSVWGQFATEAIRWRGHNPVDLAENLAGLRLELRTGNGDAGGEYGGGPDPLEANVHDESVELHTRLTELGLPHVWDDYGPGAHQWPYWARDLRLTLPGLMATFADPPPAPRAVTFTAIERDYEVYGWHVTLRRAPLELSRLEHAGADAFTLAGSGDATVVTPGGRDPGAPYAVAVATGRGTDRATLAADDAGRLHVPIVLGPANAEQQDRPGASTAVFRAHVTIDPARDASRARVPCASRRVFRVTIPARLRHARVRVAGRPVPVRGRRHRFVTIDLRGRAAGLYRVRIAGRGAQRTVRTFRTCAPRVHG